MSGAHVALIGARRVRQGLGPFVARDLAVLGARIVAILGTREDSVAAARRELRERCSLEPEGYTDLDRLLDAHSPDALIILSPAERHESWLLAALAAGLHVLCEKPLLWGGHELSTRGARIVAGFRERRLLLAENCQWPWTLAAFRELHPQSIGRVPSRFGMLLSPDSGGPKQLGDCLPHALSLLQTLAPHESAGIEAPEIVSPADAPAGLDLRFVYRAGDARVDCEVKLRPTRISPRPAAYEIDGRRAERRIELPGYRMQLRDGERSVPLPDPLTARLRDFLHGLDAVLAGARPPDPAPIAQRVALLDALTLAASGAGSARGAAPS